MLIAILQGFLIGLTLLLPGLSTGTIIVILGFYETLLIDLSALRFKKYLPQALGALAGVLLSIWAMDYLFTRYHALISAVIFGMLLASVPLVLNFKESLKISWPASLAGVSGFALTWFVLAGSANAVGLVNFKGYFLYLFGGALCGATVLLPGLSAGAMLVILNLYAPMLRALIEFQWPNLILFALGLILSLFSVARAILKLYRRHTLTFSFLLAGLILGSLKSFLPAQFSFSFFAWALLGAAPVLYSGFKTKVS